MSGAREGRSEPVGSIDELVDYLRSGEKPPEDWRVGTEHEKIGLHEDGLTPVPYEGDRGIEALLESMAARSSWQPVQEGGRVIALANEGGSVSLEPGGQLELSGAPLRTIHETAKELDDHLDLVLRAAEPLGIAFLGVGIHPIHAVDEIPRMPKQRYRIMREYLPTRGSRALVMMFTTATVQANLDYADEADMVDKVRTSLAVQPLVSALFANSAISEGKPNGFSSRRMWAWLDTDPDRTGSLPIAFEPDFGYRRYVEWALDVPMFFVLRDGHYEPAHDQTFRQFLESGRGATRATLADFDNHLTTLFPDVRVKRFIEMRGADAVPADLTVALPALWKGVLYDATARADAGSLVADADAAAREAARAAVVQRGLQADYAGRPVLELARDLAAIARDGLRRIAHAAPDGSTADETAFLDPVFAQLERGKSPGDVLLERFEGEFGRSFDRLIDATRY